MRHEGPRGDIVGVRRLDAIDAAQWLRGQPQTPSGAIDLIGWSNGGSTVFETARAADGLPHGLFERFVAFYPGCPTKNEDPTGSRLRP